MSHLLVFGMLDSFSSLLPYAGMKELKKSFQTQTQQQNSSRMTVFIIYYQNRQLCNCM